MASANVTSLCCASLQSAKQGPLKQFGAQSRWATNLPRSAKPTR